MLLGRVSMLSDSGMHSAAFAVVDVEGIARPVVVPVEKLESIPPHLTGENDAG
jgi:hypothetical protein